MAARLRVIALAALLPCCALSLDFDGLAFTAQDDVATDAGDTGTDVDGDVDDAGAGDVGNDATDVGTGDTDGGGPGDAGDDGGDVSDDVDAGADVPDGCVPGPETCDGVDNDCDGLVDDDDPDVARGPADCGACGVVCGVVPGGSTTCVDDICVIDACGSGRADLNGRADDGCEFERTVGAVGLGGVDWIGGFVDGDTTWALSERAPVSVDASTPSAPGLSALRPHDTPLIAGAAEGGRVVGAATGGGLVLFDADGTIASGATAQPVTALGMHAGAAIVALDGGAVQRFDVTTGRFVLAGNSRPVGSSTVDHLAMAGGGRDDGVIIVGGSLYRFRVRAGEPDPIEVIDDVVAAPGAQVLDVARVWTGGDVPLIDTWWILTFDGTTRSLVAVEMLPGGDLSVRGARPATGARSLSFSQDTGDVVVVGDAGQVWVSDASNPIAPGPLLEVATVEDAEPALNVAADGVAVIGRRGGVAVIDLLNPGAGVVGETAPYLAYTDVALSADGDLLAARGADGVSAAPPGAVRGSWSTDLSFDVIAIAADGELGAALGAGGDLALLRRLAPGRWSAVSQTTLEAASGAAFTDVAVRGTRVWVAAGRAGAIGIDAVFSDDRWSLSETTVTALLPDAVGGLQTSSFAEVHAFDDVLFVRGSDRLWGVDLRGETLEPRVLVFRSMSGDIISTRVTGFAPDTDGARVHIMDPSFGLVGFSWQPDEAEPFAIATPFYLDAIGERPWIPGDDVAGADGWIARASGDAGVALWWAGERQYAEGRLDDETSPWIATGCAARSLDVRDGVLAVLTDCGIERVQFVP